MDTAALRFMHVKLYVDYAMLFVTLVVSVSTAMHRSGP
jgi:hypothetical protein